ncbi:MAG: hypothetical protein A3C88_02580 [Candidatus Yanofskybacteria bacterium RIFCSPHIGHO2_02_FULL_50_12]|uniref:SH3b domain-containing protein n=1 Tax=Candidatus Yanofskybacteria bacterium RIFCSPHIGHO2_02_FULL_50_12 TaxID=1802685 RepID=A0A1F8FSX9_9BACT|nr:MAG: hypothetical protein A3C88_02580 [Candidatus Yanofskybacteria bacterium RIFCSPHIGHO2_02_FULL_50_12]
MDKKPFFSLIIFSFAFLGMFLFNSVLAADITFSQDTTVELNDVNFTIVGGSNVDQVATSGGTITILISAGQRLIFESPDRKSLTNNSSIDWSCSSTKSSITVEFPTTATQKTVTITPGSTCGSGTSGGGGGPSGGGGGGAAPASTPAPTPTSIPVSKSTPVSRGFVSLTGLSLKEGDVISAAGSSDPDIYIVNTWGYKRLFLNPVIFNFYGHLGGFSKVKNTVSSTRDTLVTSGLFRNCETNDQKVYGVESTGEDTGMLHWVNTTGDQAVADDPDFFKKVFCINTSEFNWYPKGAAYTSVNQIPSYIRTGAMSGPATSSVSSKVKVASTVDWLNIRESASTSAKIISKALPGEEYEFSAKNSGWYSLKKNGVLWGWASGDYLTEL